METLVPVSFLFICFFYLRVLLSLNVPDLLPIVILFLFQIRIQVVDLLQNLEALYQFIRVPVDSLIFEFVFFYLLMTLFFVFFTFILV